MPARISPDEYMLRDEAEEANRRERQRLARLRPTRHARMKAARARGTHTQEQWLALCTEFDHRCVRCGDREPLTKDHIIAISRGGSNAIDNIQPLCGPCNSTKGSCDRTDYAAYRRRYGFEL